MVSMFDRGSNTDRGMKFHIGNYIKLLLGSNRLFLCPRALLPSICCLCDSDLISCCQVKD